MASYIVIGLAVVLVSSAAVTGSSSGTSYKAEAARIGDDVKEMNRIINDVLTRSEDEYGTAVRKAGKKR